MYFISKNRNHILAFLSICFVAGLLYTHVLDAPFQLDDHPFIINNLLFKHPLSIKTIESIWCYTPRKFIALLTFAINYHFAKYSTFSYHLVNVCLHIFAAFFVYWFIMMLCSTPSVKAAKAGLAKHFLAVFGSLIFLVHPLQTESVTYIWQRSTLLSALFYLASLLFYIAARQRAKRLYYAVSIFLLLVGFFAKGDTITLPLIFILYEITFFELTLRKLKQKIIKIWPLFTILVFIVIANLAALNRLLRNEYFFSADQITRKVYLFTQFRVILYYLKLVFIPLGQNVEPYFTFSLSLFNLPTFLSLVAILTILGGAILLFKAQRLMAFGIFCFFICLIPNSSIIPFPNLAFEHRLYLPLAGFSIFLSSLILSATRNRWMRNIIAFGILLNLGLLTFSRNVLWRSQTALLEDAVKKSPLNGRSHVALGTLYYKAGKMDEAFELFKKAKALSATYPHPYSNLGLIYLARGDMENAQREFNTALKIREGFTDAYVNLAHISLQRGDYDGAEGLLKKALTYNQSDQILAALGNIYFLKGRLTESESFSRQAVSVNPENPLAYYNLWNIYSTKKEAQAYLDKAESVSRNKNHF